MALAALLFLCMLLGACGTPGGGAVPDGSEITFQETFDEGSSASWRLEGDEISQSVIAEGELLIAINEPATVHYVTLQEPAFANFILEVDVRQIAGNLGSSYGVLLRMADGAQQFYRFEITGNGEYIVERHDGEGAFTRLTDGWESSPALQKGLEATNHLAITAAGGTFSFYANDQLLTQVADSRYSEGTIALDAGTFGQGGLQVAFDNLVLSRP